MSKIIVYRNTEWANKWRTIDLYMDGEKLGSLEDGQTIAFEIPTGNHSLEAKIDWCGSNTIELMMEEDDIVNLEITGFLFSKYFLSVAIIAFICYMLVYHLTGRSNIFLGALIMAIFGYFIFYISIGRKHYLQLKVRL